MNMNKNDKNTKVQKNDNLDQRLRAKSQRELATLIAKAIVYRLCEKEKNAPSS